MDLTKQRGFTLIEVVVAVAILGLSSSALFGLFSTSVDNLRRIEKLHGYQIAAAEVMNRVLLLPVLPADGQAGGRLRQIDANWSVRVEPWIPESLEGRPEQAIMKIIVEVEFDGRSGRRTINLETVKPSLLTYTPQDFQGAIGDVFPD